VCLALVVAAAAPAIRATSHLVWPPDYDILRDIAAAQTIRDGKWGTDPYYANEVAWYNPLIPATMALGSVLFDVSVPEMFTRSGAWINILNPLMFFACATTLIGIEAALVATAAFLFYHAIPRFGPRGRTVRGCSLAPRRRHFSTSGSSLSFRHCGARR
jgi:hypothetical protein